MIEVRPLTEDSGGTCDWGGCDAESVAERATGDPVTPWLPVCALHSDQHRWRGTKTARGDCPACGKSYALSLKDGTMPLHSQGFARCIGSRKAPTADTRTGDTSMSTEMMLWWIVDDDGQPKGPVGMTEYCAWHADPIARERLRVARDAVGDVEVSTVQLSLDHNYVNYGPPILVESMIFGGEHDLWCRRYATRDAARAGHARIVANLSAGHAPEGADQ